MSDTYIDTKNIIQLTKREIGEDIHIIKEAKVDKETNKIIGDDIRIIKDFKRPFWVTKPIYQTYTDKKESEDLNKVQMFTTTDSDMVKNVARRLGTRYIGVKDMRQLKKSPYLYGTEVDARTILKRKYLKQADFKTSPYRVGVFDIETDTLTNTIIIITIATYDRMIVTIHKDLIKKIPNYEQKILEMYDKYIPDTKGLPIKENIKKNLEIRVFDKEIHMIKYVFKQANKMNIDFLTAWNIKYDITKILEKIEEANQSPAAVFHYDKIPWKYRYFNFKPGKDKKKMESGREMGVNPEQQWHIIKSTTNYYFIDAMASHRYVRVGGATVPGGYSLDNILEIEEVAKKLKFESNEKFKGIEWHIHMVKNKPIEYIIYNIWDVMSMLVLDWKTNDLAISVPLLSGVSHFDVFDSGPKKLVDEFFFFYLAHKKVLGVKDPTEENNKILGLTDWIVTLQAHMKLDNGLKAILEDPNMVTSINLLTADADQASGYPSNTRAANVSKDTTHRELVKIGGLDRITFLLNNIDLMYGKTNALNYAQIMFEMPDLYELEKVIN